MNIKLLEEEKVGLVELWLSMPQPKVEDTRKEIFQILEGEQQMIIKANELLKKTKTQLEILVPGDYLGQLYHSGFTDNLERSSKKLCIRLLTDNSLKSKFFLERMKSSRDYCIMDAENLPCFMISDQKELLMVIQKGDERQDSNDKKKARVVALWTNYDAFIETMQVLFSKLDASGKRPREIQVGVS
jgi:hypothetical protein